MVSHYYTNGLETIIFRQMCATISRKSVRTIDFNGKLGQNVNKIKFVILIIE